MDFAKIAYKELTVRGSIGQRWTAWRTALHLLSTKKVDTRVLITHTFPLADWRRAFECFEAREGLKIAFVG
jgi:threonine dehydrogenase-like Zn-dependent dehydrogenase